MTKYLSVIVVVAAIVVAGCSGGSSGSSGPPPVSTTTWAITSFTAADTTPFVGSVVMITARATKDGTAVPDGTTFEFTTTASAVSGFVNAAQTGIARVASEGGAASAYFLATAAGSYQASVKVGTASAAVGLTYRDRDPTGSLQVFQPLLPNRGSLNGGEQVIIQGKGITAPVEVDFEVAGETYPAIIESVVESQPLEESGSITIRTPYISGLTDEQRESDWISTVTVRVNLTDSYDADFNSEILPSAFTFLRGYAGPTSALQEPFIYLVLPDHGQTAGGEQVTVLGRNFRAVLTDGDGNVTEMPAAVDLVTFGGVQADLISISADGTQLVAQTPRWSVIPLDADQPVDVEVTTSYDQFGPFTATLQNGFVYLADEPTPEITGLAPTGGPIDGGEQVTIFGHGFQTPAQVTFGELEAINVQVNDDQSLDDQDTIICVTPDYSQQGDEPPVAVNVVVRNILTGKVSDAATYTYGENLYISGNTPVEGRPGDNIVIYGSGFEQPLHVDFGSIRLDVLSVSGTELLVRIPVDAPPSCTNVTESFTVTLLESGQVTTGGSFTFLGSTPQIYGIDPIFVSEDGGGDLIITGEYFNPNLIVDINGYRLLSNQIEVTPTTTILVNPVPTFDLIDGTWDTVGCIDDDGMPGVRIVPTPVDVTVTNLPGECTDTLTGGLVYEPNTSVCFIGLSVSPTVFDYGTVDVGSSSAPATTFTVTNNGSVTVNLASVISDHPAFVVMDPGFTVLAPTEQVMVDVYFAPTAADIIGGDDTQIDGIITFNSTGAGLPPLATEVAVTGLANAFPIMAVAPQAINFGTTAGSQPFDISNTGTAPLTWSLSETDTDGVFAENPTAGVITPGSSTTVTVTFTLAGAPAVHTGELEITASELDAQGSPVTVTLDAETPP